MEAPPPPTPWLATVTVVCETLGQPYPSLTAVNHRKNARTLDTIEGSSVSVVFTVLSDSDYVLQAKRKFQVSFLVVVRIGSGIRPLIHYLEGKLYLKVRFSICTDLHEGSNIGGAGGVSYGEHSGRNEGFLQLHDSSSLFFSSHDGKVYV